MENHHRFAFQKTRLPLVFTSDHESSVLFEAINRGTTEKCRNGIAYFLENIDPNKGIIPDGEIRESLVRFSKSGQIPDNGTLSAIHAVLCLAIRKSAVILLPGSMDGACFFAEQDPYQYALDYISSLKSYRQKIVDDCTIETKDIKPYDDAIVKIAHILGLMIKAYEIYDASRPKE